MRVFRVRAEVEVEFFVVAEDEEDAESVAEMHASDVIEEEASLWPHCSVTGEVARVDDVPKEWRNSLPYGDHDGRTIAQILTEPEGEPKPTPDTWTIPMFQETKP